MIPELIDKKANNKEIYLRVKVLPSAGETRFMDKMADGTIKIAVAAPPEKGKANQALVKYLASEFKVVKTQVKILSGAGDRLKLVKIIF